MYAYNLSRVDREREMYMQAWVNHQVTATKKSGDKQVPMYKKFSDFYDYEKRLKEVEHNKKSLPKKYKKMARLAAIVNEGR